MVGVGNSGLVYALELGVLTGLPACFLPVKSIESEFKRQDRNVEADPIKIAAERAVLVDDVTVSGKTLRAAVRATDQKVQDAMVGLIFEGSDIMLQLAKFGVSSITCALRYRSEYPKMKVPVNTLQTLLDMPERLQAVNDKYFGCKTRILRQCLIELAETTQ